MSNPIGQSPSWDVDIRKADKEIQLFLWELNFYYKFHKSPPPDPVIS